MNNKVIEIKYKYEISKKYFNCVDPLLGKFFKNDFFVFDFKKIVTKNKFKSFLIEMELDSFGIKSIIYITSKEIDRILRIKNTFFDEKYIEYIINKELNSYGISVTTFNPCLDDKFFIMKSFVKFDNYVAEVFFDIESINIDESFMFSKKNKLNKNIILYPNLSLFHSEINTDDLESMESGDILIVYPNT